MIEFLAKILYQIRSVIDFWFLMEQADPVLDDIKEVCQSPVTQEDQVIKVNKPVEVRINYTYCCPKVCIGNFSANHFRDVLVYIHMWSL